MRNVKRNRHIDLDERPIELLSLEERFERYNREIGADADRLNDVDYKTIREAYGLPNDRLTV